MTEAARKSRLPRTGMLLPIAVVLLIGCIVMIVLWPLRPTQKVISGVVSFIAGGMLMGWLPYYLNQKAIAEIGKVGGEIESEIIRPFWIIDAVDDKYLKLFERVVQANLDNTRISDAWLEHLEGLTNLQSLRLDKTQVSDTGIRRLRGLAKLVNLSLNNTKVSDAGLMHLPWLTNLEYLSLNNNQVSDEGLKRLKMLTDLNDLSLHNTKVTQAGIDELQKALPDCGIYWSPPAE